MSPGLTTFLAILRRFATLAGTALLAMMNDNWREWLEKAINGDSSAIIWLPLIYAAVEAIQKYWREKKKANSNVL